MRGRPALAIAAILLFAPAASLSGAQPLRHSGWPTAQVFSDREINGGPQMRAVLAHPDGLIYVAHVEGLVEYDGVSWRVIPGTGGLIVHNVMADAGGRIWYSATGEFGWLVANAEGVLVAQSLQAKLPAADRNVGHVLRMAVHGAEAYFVTQGARGFVARVDARGEVRELSLPPGERPVSLFVHEGAVHVITTAGVYRAEGDTLRRAPEAQGVAKPGVFSMWPRAGDGAWIVAIDGLRIWRDGAASPVSGDVAALLGDDRVSCGCPLGDGTFALGTEKHGVLIVATATGRVLARYDDDIGFGAGSSNVVGITTDAQGGLWVARFAGMTRIQLHSPAARHDGALGVRGRVQGFALHRGRLHVATTQGVFVREPSTNRFVELRGNPGDSWALVSTEDGLMVGGTDLRLLRDDGTVEMIDPERLLFRSALRLRRDPNRIVASTGPGLVRVYRKTGDGWRFEAGLPQVHASLFPLLEDDEGFLWATRNRLEVMRLDWRGGVRFDAPLEAVGPRHGLPSSGPRDRFWINLVEGSLQVSGAGGLWRHERGADRFVNESRITGFDAQRWPRIFPLSDGSLWLAAAGGIDDNALALRTGPGAWQVDPLPYTGLGSVTPLEVRDEPATGTIWVGHLGLMSFDRAWRGAPPAGPIARLRSVTAANDTIVWGGAGMAPRATLAAERNALRFAFAAAALRPDAYARVATQYRTRLVGFDRGWSDWSEGVQKDYANLPPGAFSFRVQARDDARRMGPEATFEFELMPPWWRTWWFIVLASGAGIAVVAAVTRWYSQRVWKRRVALLEAQSAVERERLRLARDLHDEVGSGLGRVILFAEEAERGSAHRDQLMASLQRVRTTAKELVVHAREIVWAVSPQHDTLASVIDRLDDYVADTLRAAGIACQVYVPGAAEIPPVILGSEARHSLFLAVKEAVHNCVKYSEAKTAEFSLRISGNDFVVTLRDHGRGFASGEIHGTGHGFVNLTARAKIFGGSADITSAVGEGTTVTVRVPLVPAP